MMFANKQDRFSPLAHPAKERPGFQVAAAIAIYCVVLTCLSEARPLWVDELLQLFGTRELSGSYLFQYVSGFPGAAPLGYFVQHWSFKLLGVSVWSARVSSEAFSVLGCMSLVMALRQLRLGSVALLFVFFWMILPLQLRYALEARPYSQGLCVSLLSTLFFLRLYATPSVKNWAAYTVLLILGAYTAPYTLFVQAGYIVVAVVAQTNRVLRTLVASALALSGFTYLPWYLVSAGHWKGYLAQTAEVGFRITPKFVLLPIQEISGGGYVCSLALLSLAVIGYRSHNLNLRVKLSLLLGIIIGMFGAIGTDMLFGYFFAIRQIMFILVPIFLLAAAGLSAILNEKRWIIGVVLGVGLFLGSIVKDTRYVLDRSEDWAAAADAVQNATSTGACLLFIRNDDDRFYTFFKPSLKQTLCSTASRTPSTIVVPSTRYSQGDEIHKLHEELEKAGYVKQTVSFAGGATITTYIIEHSQEQR